MDEEVKVSELAEASSVNDEDLLMIVQNGINKKTSVDTLLTNIESEINEVDAKVGNWGNASAISDYTGDMNDLKVSGWYATGTINTNLPTNEAYYVMVMVKNPDYYIKQIAFKRNNYMIYERHKDNGVWSNWTKIDNSVSSYDGDLNNLTTTGFYYVSGSSTNIPATGFSHYVTVYKLSDKFICQVAYRVTNTTQAQYQFVRQRYNGAWTNWRVVGGQILWTNSSPSTQFTEQDITLSSSDYTFLEWVFNDNNYSSFSVKVAKGYGLIPREVTGNLSTTSYMGLRFREITRISDTKFHVGPGKYKTFDSKSVDATTYNSVVKPLYVIGY